MMKNIATPRFQSILVVSAIALAYILLHFTFAATYALQIFLSSIVLFFVLKRVNKAKLWHVLPSQTSMELGLLTFAFVFLIGATGNTHSLFYALSYIHLFIIIFTTSPTTAAASIIALITFHYALEPELNTTEIGSILSLPVIGVILMFAKKQYDEASATEELLEKEVAELNVTSHKEKALETFVDTFLAPKLDLLEKLLSDPDETKETLKKQLSLLNTEMNKILGRINSIDK